MVPVYLGDSVQWGQEETLLSAEALTVPTSDGAQLFADELRFPDRLLQDAGQFDRLVSDLADKAAHRRPGSAVPSLKATFRLFAVHPDDQPMLTQTFTTMCRLYDEGRNHIWGYYVRNLARPIWLSHPANRVYVLVGNPPWLAYRFMPSSMQATFRQMARERRLWAGGGSAPANDLSALFIERSIELYLQVGGQFGFVMPLATLTRRTYAGFRSGRYPVQSEPVTVAFDRPWDLHGVKPAFFPVPACVVFGSRSSSDVVPLEEAPESWSGRLPSTNASLAVAAEILTHVVPGPEDSVNERSSYADRFSEGATMVPRVLVIVERQPAPVLGAGAGRIAIRSDRSPKEKAPWKALGSLAKTVEIEFVRPLLIGETLLPFRLRDPLLAVVPWDGHKLLAGSDERMDYYPGLASWWREAEGIWKAHRSTRRMELLDRLNFRHGLDQQFPIPQHRVVYSASGMYLAAAYVDDQRAVVEHKLYWGAAASAEEARYIVGFLNSETITQRVRPLQGRGQHNPRDFDKYVWRTAIPLYDPSNEEHQALSQLAAEAEDLVANLELASGISFEALRRRARQAVAASAVGRGIESLVTDILRGD